MFAEVDNLWIKFRINCDGYDDLCIKILLLPVGGIFILLFCRQLADGCPRRAIADRQTIPANDGKTAEKSSNREF